jgi:putative ABC transport system permease protein
VIGIVGDVRDGMPLEQDEQPAVYVPLAQLLDRESASQAPFALAWVVRTAVESNALTRSIQRELAQATAGEPVTDVGSMRQLAARAIAPTTFSMVVLIVFGASALLLAGIGLYGVIAHAVQQRAREIAIRLAVGARWIDIRNMVLLDGLKLVSLAVAVGVTVAAAMVRWLTAFLYGVLPHDVTTFATASLLVCTVAMAAVWVPARRAATMDPVEALRRL